jgi:SWI/SNF-related matrix-associated actin-dependent regulator 1 of chromatin subfamily A
VKLDYNPGTRAFILRVKRGEGDPKMLMEEHGLDFSATASTPGEAVLFTHEPYAAAAFHAYATPAAAHMLSHIQTEVDASWAKDSGAHIKCPADQELAGFQKAGVEFALRRQNTLIGDVPGLGKTMQAICFANEIDAKRVLVICPASIRLQWAKKIREWSTMRWPYVIYPVLHGRHGVHPNAQWTVISYDLARSPAIGKALAAGLYDLLILDEAHYLKTVDAARTRAVFGGGEDRQFTALAERCGAILGLTGTPLPNRPREAYTILRGMNFDAIDFMSEEAFRFRFNPAIKRETEEGKIYIDERTGRHGELQTRLRANLMVRREKHGPNGVSNQLKLPFYDIVHIEETGAVKQALQAESMLDIDPEDLTGADMTILGHISVVRRMMGVAIAPLAADYIEMLLDGGEEKVIVFGWHIEVLNILQQRLDRYGVVRIDGSVGAARKQVLVDSFREDLGKRVCLGNLLSMGTGTDGLQDVAQHVIFAEADWTPGNNQQGVDRLDRMGQKGQVQADFLVAPGSFSERILASALRKNATVNKVLDRRI